MTRQNEVPDGVQLYRSKEIAGTSPIAPSIDWIIEYPDGSLEAWVEVLSAHPQRNPYDPDGERIDLDDCREVNHDEFPDEILQDTFDL